MIVSHRHRFIFMKTRKTAGTSVEIALSKVCGPDDVICPLMRADEALRAESGGRPSQNYDGPRGERFFEHMRASRAQQLIGREVWDSYTKIAIERNPWDLVVSLYFWVNRHRHDLTFDQFLAMDVVANVAASNFRAYHIRGQLAVNRVLRFESLRAEVGEVWTELGLPGTADLPHAKAGLRTDGGSYREHYTPASRDVVAHLFARQIAAFAYEF